MRILRIFLVFSIIFPPTLLSKPIILTSIRPLMLVVKDIGGNKVEVHSIVEKGMDPHSYEPSLKDAAKAREAKLCVMIGLRFDEWMEDLCKDKKILSLSQSLNIKGNNPHIWLDPYYIMDFSRELRDALKELGVQDVNVTWKKFAVRLGDNIKKLESLSSRIPSEKRSYMAIHPAWTYFSRRFHLNEALVFFHVPVGEPSFSKIRKAMELKKRGVRLLIANKGEGKNLVEAISRKLDLKVIYLDPLAWDYSSYPDFILSEGKKLIESLME